MKEEAVRPGRLVEARIVSNEAAAPGFWLAALKAPEIALAAVPGQFVMVRVAPRTSLDPLLRRALAVHRADREKGRISVLYGVVGRATEMLTHLGPGERLDLLGPLGRGFDLDPGQESLLVAGGVGAAPLLFLAEEIRRQGGAARLFYGCRSAQGMVEAAAFEALGIEVVAATEDGSRGHRGLVTDVLLPALMSGGVGPPHARVYACGPKPMLAAVARLCRGVGVACQVSLHAFMGCGIGACLGCAVARPAPPGQEPSYAKVCVDGPVFDAEEVFL